MSQQKQDTAVDAGSNGRVVLSTEEKWDKVHERRLWGTCPEPWVCRWAMRRWRVNTEVKPGSVHLMDVGCGVGPDAMWLAENGFVVDGFDASPHAIRRARERNRHTPHSARFSVGIFPDCARLSPANYYDGAYDVCCLQHADDPETCIQQIMRAIKPGGSFLSIFATDGHDIGDLIPEELVGSPFWRLDQNAVTAMFGPHGKHIKVERMGHTDGPHVVAHWIIMVTK